MKKTILFLSITALTAGVAALSIWAARPSYIYPTPETQSSFFKSYSPTTFLDRFALKKYSSHYSAPGESIAGKKFVTHRKDWSYYFVISARDLPSIAHSIGTDVSDQLAKQGARLLSETETANGFEIKYELGNTRGLIDIDPAKPIDPTIVVGKVSLCVDQTAVLVRLRMAETWSPIPRDRRDDRPTFREL